MNDTQKIDTDAINVILATDCGSTTTKAIMIEKVDGVSRQTWRRASDDGGGRGS